MESTTLQLGTTGKIKIKEITPYEVLDATGIKVCQELKVKWAHCKNSNVTAKVLTNYFENSTNACVATLEMMINAQDFFVNKPNSLAMFVIQTFGKWKEGKEEAVSKMLTDKIKIDAFKLLLGHKNLSLLSLVAKEFNLIQDKMRFLPLLKEYLRETKNYKEACDWAIGLQLDGHFSIDDFLLPLLLQGKFPIALSYLEKSRCLRIPVVIFLDGLLSNRVTEGELTNVARRLNVSEVKLHQLGFKSVTKLISKLVKAYNISPSLTPNLMKSKGKGALSFLLHKKFTEKTISDAGWTEMVIEAVQGDISLQADLVIGVTNHGDLKNAFEWAMKFNVPRYRWPIRLQQFVDSHSRELHSSSTRLDRVENPPVSDEYHKLAIPETSIILVDTVQKLESFLNELAAKNIKLVGLDAEWKPTFGFRRCELALIQIATLEKVFIVDMVKLNADSPRERLDGNAIRVWERFAMGFFGNPIIVKLGFGMTADLSAVKDIFRRRGITRLPEIGFLDLATVAMKLVEEHKLVLPYAAPRREGPEEAQTSSMGLSSLVKMTMGKCLNKSDQFSNWERRPLRKEQVIYAALDAYCLLEVYDVLHKECERQRIPIEEITSGIRILGMSKKAKRRRRQPPPGARPVSQYRVLCDKPLTDVGKLLRQCGVDTTIIDMTQEIQASVFEGKVPLYVITQREDCTQFKNLGRVFRIRNKDLRDQAYEVLRYLNVDITDDDLCTRCLACNSREFELFPREELEKLMKLYERFGRLNGSNFYENIIEFHEFLLLHQSYYPSNEEKGRTKTKKGAVVRFLDLSEDDLKAAHVFFVCSGCGKCYWEGNQSDPRYEIIIDEIIYE